MEKGQQSNQSLCGEFCLVLNKKKGGFRLRELDIYLSSIVKGLGEKEDQEDLKEELRDHLLSLRQEYIEQGFSIREATKKAIDVFGKSKELNNGLEKALFPYKTVGKTILIAIVILISILLYKSFWDMGIFKQQSTSNLTITATKVDEDADSRHYSLVVQNNDITEIKDLTILAGTHPIRVLAEPKKTTLKASEYKTFAIDLPIAKNKLNEKTDKLFLEMLGTKAENGNKTPIKIKTTIPLK